ncbi:MAG: dihydropteroate synthase [Hadesarchaea archaeon]|nr:dihydropteroate synthase [Hadesarchaea archaeon]
MSKEISGIPVGSGEPTIIMGVINIAPETFYEKSKVEDPQEAVARAKSMIKGGAQIIDLGAMSTAPGVEPISPEEEKNRLLPVLREMIKQIDVPISVDTQRASVAETALGLGAQIINDVSGLKSDEEMASVVASENCPVILMAAGEEPGDAQDIGEVKTVLRESLEICNREEVNLDKVLIDPGVGFGKNVNCDLQIIRNLGELKNLGHPICIGLSRKSFIGEVLNLDNPKSRLWGSLGATAVAIMNGADLIRTHDPRETTQLVRIIESINEGF